MPPPILFTRCEDDTAFTQPVMSSVSSPFTKLGTPTYAVGKYDNGLQGTINAGYSFDPTGFYSNNDIGCMEFWWKPAAGYDASDQWLCGGFDGAAGKFGVFVRITGSGSTLNMRVHVTGGTAYLNYTVGTGTFSIGTNYHLAITWNRSGIGGGGNYSEAFVNGSSVSASSTAIPAGVFGANGCGIACYPTLLATHYTRGVIDNMKLYDYDKTDFNDRWNERGGLNDMVINS